MLELKAKIGQKGQAVIPKPIRDQLGLKPGDEIRYWIEGDHAALRGSKPMTMEEWLAGLPRFDLPADFDVDAEVDRAMEEGW